MLTSKNRAYLRGLSHDLDTIFQIGKGGITEELCLQIGNALEARELIKARVLDNSGYTAKEAANEIAEAVSCDESAESYVLDSAVELTELLGDNTNVYVDLGRDKAILKVDPRKAPRMDESFRFSIPYRSVYVFDKETGKTIVG